MNNENAMAAKFGHLRDTCDLTADNFIKEIILKKELANLNLFFKEMFYNYEIEKLDLPPELAKYFSENDKLPEWADKSKIELAQQAFSRIGPSFILAYFCKSLPECYACGKGAEVLYDTGRLTNHTRRRIAQTAQFVLDVMSPGGLEPNGRGIATSVKVRLMHSSIRYYLNSAVENNKAVYDFDKNGKPINQEDLLGTMLAFSTVVIEGMQKLGFKVSDDEKEGIVHLWNCTGYLIGIDEKYMPADFSESEQIWNYITTNLNEKTQAGQILTKNLVDFLDEILHERILKEVVPILMYSLMGENTCKLLDVRTPKYYNPLAFLALILGIMLLKFESRGMISRIASHYVNLKLLNALENYIAEGENTGLYIPTGLRDDWQIDSPVKAMFNAMNK